MQSYESSITPNPEDAELRQRTARQSKLRIYTEQLIKATEAGSNPKELGRLYYSIAAIHDEMFRFFEAETYFRAAAYSFELVDEPAQEAQAWRQVGTLRAYLGIFIEPPLEETFERSRRAGKRANSAFLQAQAVHDLGRLKQEQNDFEGALADFETALSLLGFDGDVDETPAATALRNYILEGIAAVRLEQLLIRARELAERTNQDAETPETAPGDPIDLPPLPTQSRSSQGSRFWWWRRGRN